MNKQHDKIMGMILVALICIVAVIWGTQDSPQVRHAKEASHAEVLKPDGHGR